MNEEMITFGSLRRFGVEIEVNAFDMRARPIGYLEGALPAGINYIANLVGKVSSEKVVIHKWGNDHHNDCWILKPDGSCGMEICTPVLKGWSGLMRLCRVVQGLSQDSKVTADSRCSLHVHIDVSDLSESQIASIITWWIKSEAVFMDSVPSSRKRNQYCQFLSQTDIFENIEDGLLYPETLLKKVGHCKYYSMNTYHYQEKKRKTIEFRIMDSACCLDPWMAKNWVRMILHFVETSIHKGLPIDYQFENKWSGYCWLDPIDVFSFLKFDSEKLSPGLEQVRRWFLGRLFTQGRNSGLNGILSDKGRRISIEQVDQLIARFYPEGVFLPVSDEDIYGDKFLS